MDVVYKRGDTYPPLDATLTWADGTPIDLTGASVVFTLRDRVTRNVVIDRRPVLLIDPANGVVRVVWQAGDFAVPGEYDGEFEVTLPGGSVVTVPNDRYIRITVVPDLG